MRQTRRHPKQFVVLMLVLMVTLMSLGLAYASWTQTITVNSTVQTATISAKWVSNDEAPFAINCVKTDPLQIGSIGAQRDAEDESLMHVVLTGAYPGFEAACFLTWKNSGDVPIRTVDHQINGIDAYSGVTLNLDDGAPNDDGDDVWVQFSNGVGSTLPGVSATDKIIIVVLETATPGANLELTGTHTFELAN